MANKSEFGWGDGEVGIGRLDLETTCHKVALHGCFGYQSRASSIQS